jgi:hypothetical protein
MEDAVWGMAHKFCWLRSCMHLDSANIPPAQLQEYRRLLLSAPVPVTTILWPHFVMYGMRKCTLMRRSLSEGIWLTAPYVGPDISAMNPPAGPILQGACSKSTLRYHTAVAACARQQLLKKPTLTLPASQSVQIITSCVLRRSVGRHAVHRATGV